MFLTSGTIFAFLLCAFLTTHNLSVYADGPTVTTIISSEDTYVDSANPATNYGSRTTLWIDASPSVKRGLIRFNLSNLPAGFIVNAATLKLSVSTTDGSPVAGSISAVSGSWAEKTVTYSNSPTVGTQIIALPNPASPGISISVNVTNAVISRQVVDFYITTPNSDGLLYYTREAGSALAPQLIITWSTGSTTPTSTPGPTQTASPDPTSTVTPPLIPTLTSTPLPTGSDPVLVAAGDIICDSLITTSGGCQQMAVSQVAVNQGPTSVLILGDLCHTPSANCFNNYYAPSWGRLSAITHPITGNHEYLAAGAVYYFDYWNGVGNTNGPAGNRSQGYYSYDIGAWHLIALNSQCGDAGGCNNDSPQYTWLQQDLQNHPNQCTLAYYHIPVFSSGGRANNNMLQIYTLLYNNNVDVVLDGHDHIYERFAPQDPGGKLDPNRGIREFIVGTGGANHTSIATIAANSEVRNANTFGVLKLALHPTSYDWQFVPEAGGTFTDSGTQACHSSTLPTPTATATTAASATSTATLAASPTATATATPTATLAARPTATATATPTATLAASPTATATATPTATLAASPTATATATSTPTLATSPTATTTATPTATLGTSPTATATATSTPTLATSPTATATSTPTATLGTSPTATATSTPTATLAASPTPTATTQASTVFSDGFESGNLANWTTVQSLVVQSQVVDTGSFAARATSAGGTTGVYARKTLSAPQIDLYYRIHLNVLSMAANTFNVIKFRTAANVSILSVSINNLGNLSYHNDITGTSVNSTTRVNLGAWQSLEVHLHIADTASLIETWYNGSPVAVMTRTDSFGTTPTGILQLGENTPGMTYDVAYDDVVAATGLIAANVPLAVGPVSTPLVLAAFRNINRRH